QGHVVGGSQVGQLGGPVTMLNVRVGLVQSPGSPGGTFNVLVEFWEHYFQFSMVKIPCDHMHCFRVFIHHEVALLHSNPCVSKENHAQSASGQLIFLFIIIRRSI
ncbi:hypothetical protein GOODEAATRI_030186, partial [Goodea atripinnis]